MPLRVRGIFIISLMLKSPHMKWAKQTGFTIVELLIVIVVIAILAAITIVAYNGIQNRARESAIQAAASQAGRKALAYAPTNNDQYPAEVDVRTELSLPTDTAQATYDYYVSGNRKAFCLSTTDTTRTPAVSYAFTQNGSGMKGRCIKNIIVNPTFETGTYSWGNGSVTPSVATNWSKSGVNGLRQVPNSTGTDSYSTTSINTGMTSDLVVLNEPYTISGVFYQSAALSGTLDNGRSRRIVGYTWAGSTAGTLVSTPGGANTAGESRQAGTLTVTSSSVNRIELRLYNGASNSATNATWWDAIMLTRGTTDYQYADGDSPGWSWTGDPHASTSFGPGLPQ
jgi:prepilin-type N-terminal cleavage/methylation domain-containing protein